MIVYLLELRHADEDPPRWMAKEAYNDQDLANARSRDLKALSMQDPQAHPHLYRVRAMHVAERLPSDDAASITMIAAAPRKRRKTP